MPTPPARDDNPYAAPMTDLRPPEPAPAVPAAVSAWRDGTQLVLGEAADLSPRCARCGRPAEVRVLLELMVEGKRRLWVGFCGTHRRRRSLVRQVVLPTLLTIIFGSGWFAVVAVKTMSTAWTVGLGSMGFVLLVLLFLVAERPVVTFQGLEPADAGLPLVRLGGLHPEALLGLDEWGRNGFPTRAGPRGPS